MTYQFTRRPLTLFSNTEMLPKCIAWCNLLSSNLINVECIFWRSGLSRSERSIWTFSETVWLMFLWKTHTKSYMIFRSYLMPVDLVHRWSCHLMNVGFLLAAALSSPNTHKSIYIYNTMENAYNLDTEHLVIQMITSMLNVIDIWRILAFVLTGLCPTWPAFLYCIIYWFMHARGT